MKKQILIISICACILAIVLGTTIYNEVIAKSFRYSTPEESFEKSSPHNTELVDIIESDNIALVLYKNKEGTFFERFIAKDERGWTPLSVSYPDKKEKMEDDVFYEIKVIQNKNIIRVETIIEKDHDIPIITDSLDSKFINRSYELVSGRILVVGLLVIENQFPDHYNVIVKDKVITIY